MSIASKIRKILNEGLVSPVLKLKETHPDHYFTEKGYDRLLNNTTEEIMDLIKKANKQ